MRRAEHIATMAEKMNAYEVSIGKPKEAWMYVAG
jgi:hypothetical protein